MYYTNTSPLFLGLLLSILLSTRCHATTSRYPRDNGVHARSVMSSCLQASGVSNFSMAGSPGYDTVFNFSIQNLRFAGPEFRKPEAVVLPTSRRGLQHAVLCARSASLAIRVRSGGHSYEGQSYTVSGGVLDGKTPFVVIDLMNLNKVRVRVRAASATAWAQSGATLGEVYHAAAHSSSPSSNSNRSLAFSAASCSTIGLGGHISGGGFGPLSRKFMLAADNVLDAILIDAVGRVLDRRAMGEDLFWAIRGGGGGSWGVVYAWKLQLVPVPDTVTVFTPRRDGSVDAIAGLVYRWQLVGPALPDEFYLSVTLDIGSLSPLPEDRDHRNVTFTGLVLGPKELALSVLNERYPELGLTEAEVSEMSWVESAARLAGLDSVDELTSRVSKTKSYVKIKSDYVEQPISRDSLAKIFRYLSDGPPGGYMTMEPYGGAMDRLSATATPFPHRAGNLYALQYGGGNLYEQWLLSLYYAVLTPHVSSDPRRSYVNYIDIDLMGVYEALGPDPASVSHARATWGAAYFTVENFDRLVQIKKRIDPGNVFYNAQSIPLH